MKVWWTIMAKGRAEFCIPHGLVGVGCPVGGHLFSVEKVLEDYRVRWEHPSLVNFAEVEIGDLCWTRNPTTKLHWLGRVVSTWFYLSVGEEPDVFNARLCEWFHWQAKRPDHIPVHRGPFVKDIEDEKAVAYTKEIFAKHYPPKPK